MRELLSEATIGLSPQIPVVVVKTYTNVSVIWQAGKMNTRLFDLYDGNGLYHKKEKARLQDDNSECFPSEQKKPVALGNFPPVAVVIASVQDSI